MREDVGVWVIWEADVDEVALRIEAVSRVKGCTEGGMRGGSGGCSTTFGACGHDAASREG